MSKNNKEYMRRYMAERYKRRMDEAKRALGGKCVRCGSVDDLEFDHIDPATKLFTIGRQAAGKNETDFRIELAKCQLLCHSCHVDKSREEGSYSVIPYSYRIIPIHGTSTMYVKHKCRCEACRIWKRTSRRQPSVA